MTLKTDLQPEQQRRRISRQVQTIESMVEHLQIKDLWYETFIKKEPINNK